MKVALVCFILTSALALAGCADELEQQTPQDVQQHFRRGLRGEGKLGPVDRSNDPFEHPNQPSSPDIRPNPPPQS